MVQDLKTELNQKISNYFKKLYFNEEQGHKYTLDDKILISVSTILKSFIAPVDWNQKAHGTAYKKGVTVGQIKRNWAYERDISIVQGHRTHHFGELLGPNCREPETNQERAILKFWSNVDKNRYIRVAKEVRMYHKTLFFSGTCDFILYDTWTNTFVIGDYKTNKDLFKNYMNKKMLFPFDMLLDNPLSHYEIQLSLYEILLEQLQIPVSERWVIWLMNDGKCREKKMAPASYKVYKTPSHASALLNWLHQQNNFYYYEK